MFLVMPNVHNPTGDRITLWHNIEDAVTHLYSKFTDYAAAEAKRFNGAKGGYKGRFIPWYDSDRAYIVFFIEADTVDKVKRYTVDEMVVTLIKLEYDLVCTI